MPFIHRNHVIQQVSSAALDPTLGNSVLPGASERGPHGVHLQRSNSWGNVHTILGIPIEDQKPESRFKRKGLPQLLDDPQARGMLGDVDVQNAAPGMGDDEKTIEHTESNRRNRKKVHGGNGFPVIAKKGEPSLGCVGVPRRSFHPAGSGSFGDLKAEHEELAVDAWCSPRGVLGHHLEDQLPNFFGYLPPSDEPFDLRNEFPTTNGIRPGASEPRFRA